MTSMVTRPPILSVRRAWVLAIGIVLIHRLLMIVTVGNMALRSGLNDLFFMALSLAGMIGLFYAARCSANARRTQIAWTLLGAGISLVVLGAIVYAILDVLGLGTLPSIADGFYLMFYPIFGAGLILLAGPSFSRPERVKSLLDIAIVMLAAFLAFWITVIAPTFAVEQNAEPLIVAVAVAYPVCDWALIFAILRVLFSRPGHVRSIPLLLLACAALGQVIGDWVYLSRSLTNIYVPGEWVDSVFVLCFTLLLVAVVYQIVPQPERATKPLSVNTANMQFGWAVYIPLVGIVGAYALLVWAYDHPFAMSFQIMAWAVGGMMGLVAARQIIVFQENARLTQQLQAELVERIVAEQTIRRLNEDLERRVLERTAALTQEIAERQQVQIEREKLVAELEAKNTELDQFTYTVSHDLKAPLITIRGFLGWVEQDALAGNVERVQSDMIRITEAADKMERLLTDLLELSRIGRTMKPPQVIPFEIIACEVVALMHGRIQAGGIHINIATDLPFVLGDRVRLVQALQNLVDNACKFMGDQPDPRIEIGARGTDVEGKPILFVRDNGVGIEPQHHDRVFGLFDKLDPQNEGTGIGLALVKRIVEIHGGRIWIESEGAGQGSMFCFTLTGC
jgi:signal transduction histidine kinase